MLPRKYFLSKFCVPFGRAIRSSVGFQILLTGLLLCAANVVQSESGLPSGNDSKAQSGTATSRQLAVLLDPADPDGKRYSGYVVWRIETIQQTGEKPDIGIRADIEIPGRNLKVAISLKRNRDLYLPANHKIEMSFALAPGSSREGVYSVLRVGMRKLSEPARGTTLAGADETVTDRKVIEGKALKVGEDFVFRLSDRAYNNLKLIDELSWFEVPILL